MVKRLALVKQSVARRVSSVSFRTVGLIGIAEEAIFQHGERPTLLLIFGSMLGLPTFLQVDKTTKEPAAPAHPAEDSKAGGATS